MVATTSAAAAAVCLHRWKTSLSGEAESDELLESDGLLANLDDVDVLGSEPTWSEPNVTAADLGETWRLATGRLRFKRVEGPEFSSTVYSGFWG
jgi:hypothetical protein